MSFWTCNWSFSAFLKKKFSSDDQIISSEISAAVSESSASIKAPEVEGKNGELFRKAFGISAKKESCLICFEEGVNTAVLCCLKSFHVSCLSQWLGKGNSNCPCCRASIDWPQETKKKIVIAPVVPWLNLAAVTRFLPDSDDGEENNANGEEEEGGYFYCHDCGEYHD